MEIVQHVVGRLRDTLKKAEVFFSREAFVKEWIEFMIRYDKVELAFNFFCIKEKDKKNFTLNELAQYTGWKIPTCRTYVSKRWHHLIKSLETGLYYSEGISALTLNEFVSLHRQKFIVNQSNSNLTELLNKARDFALLAVGVYNNPLFKLKTYGYIVNICIAFTALFQAILVKREIDIFEKDKEGNFIEIDGEKKYISLKECCNLYWNESSTPERENLNLLIGLRNRIEHKDLPHLDLLVAGYCLSSLSNFEDILIHEFGQEYALMAHLAIALQLTKSSIAQQDAALKAFQKENYKFIREYIKQFSEKLDLDVAGSQRFRLNVFLVPKIGNNLNTSDLALEFVDATKMSEEDLKNYDTGIALIKGVKSPFKYRPGKVVELIKDKDPGFNMSIHTQLWKKHKARPQKINKSFQRKYSGYVEGFDGYLYTMEWVDFLISILNDSSH